jgi:hypothetical protein
MRLPTRWRSSIKQRSGRCELLRRSGRTVPDHISGWPPPDSTLTRLLTGALTRLIWGANLPKRWRRDGHYDAAVHTGGVGA